ncbi:MAG: tail completion protein gp17 [Ktedonobacterales bacterium]
MDESLEGLAWLIAQLQASSSIMAALTSGVWPFQAPQGATPPYCVITPMGGHDVLGVAATRKMWEGTYQVRLWGYATASDALKTTGNSVDTLLQRTRGSTATASIIACFRDYPLTPLPDWDGQQLRIGIGGLYRLQVRAL